MTDREALAAWLLAKSEEHDADWAAENQPISQGGPRHDGDPASPYPHNYYAEALHVIASLAPSEAGAVAWASRAELDEAHLTIQKSARVYVKKRSDDHHLDTPLYAHPSPVPAETEPFCVSLYREAALREPAPVPAEAGDIEGLIAIWSMRPPPNSPVGQAWEMGCRQGYKWGSARRAAPVPAEYVRVSALMRALHKLDCHEADEDERREGREPPEKWADPWHPSSTRQLEKLRKRAEFLLAALAASPSQEEGR